MFLGPNIIGKNGSTGNTSSVAVRYYCLELLDSSADSFAFLSKAVIMSCRLLRAAYNCVAEKSCSSCRSWSLNSCTSSTKQRLHCKCHEGKLKAFNLQALEQWIDPGASLRRVAVRNGSPQTKPSGQSLSEPASRNCTRPAPTVKDAKRAPPLRLASIGVAAPRLRRPSARGSESYIKSPISTGASTILVIIATG